MANGLQCSIVQKTCSVPNASSNGESDHSFVPQLLFVTIEPHSVLFAFANRNVVLQKYEDIRTIGTTAE